MLPLSGLKILDFSKVLAGPLCTQYLADMGADVIKVEPRLVGDDTRAWPPQRPNNGSVFLSVNRNKRSIALDLKSEAAREIVADLARQANVVVESFGTGVSERLGIDYSTLSTVNRSLVYCSISGFGRDGPMARHPGYDLMMQAFGGLLSTMGERGSDTPIRATFSPVDQMTGMHALSGILAALLRQRDTGQGAYLEVSLFETALGLMGWLAQDYWLTGTLPKRLGTSHASLCPYQVFRAADGHVLVAVGNDAQWKRLCPILDIPELAEDSRFRTNPDRVARFDETVAIVQRQLERQSISHWVATLSEAGIPCAPLNNVDAVLAHPQTAARGMVLEYSHPQLGEMKSVAHPVRFDGAPRHLRLPPPMLGEHSVEILKELHYETGRIDELLSHGIVGAATVGGE